MDRRSFIKLTAITGTTATLASCGSPENQIIRFVPDEELVPGVAEWKPGVCPLCASGCGLTVRVMEADVETTRGGQHGVVRMGVAKKLEGSPSHPVNQGGLCARGQAAIQVTYHPDRITQPLTRAGTRGDGAFAPITWEQAIAEIVSKLDALESSSDQKALAIVTRGGRSRREELLGQFAARFGAAAPIAHELFGDDVLRRANGLSFGHEQLPTFDLANARYVISFGADFLGTWNSPVAQNAAFGHMRQGRPGIRGTLVQVEARMTPTGGSADEWVPVMLGTEGVLALGIAHIILREKLQPAETGRAGAQIEGWSGGLASFAPDAVEKITGVPVARLERLAREFAGRRPAVAIAGGPPLAHTNGLFTALAVNALNAVVGAIGQPGGVFFTPQFVRPPAAGARPATGRLAAEPVRRIDTLAAGVLAGAESPVKVLLVDQANPVFTTPRAWKVREAFAKIPFIVSFGSFVDETSVMADLVLPDHSFLESWTESLPESGSLMAVASVAGPVMKPLFQTRATPDVLLQVASALHRPLALPWQTFDEMVKASFDTLGEDAWATAQKQGGWWGDLPRAAAAVAPGPAPAGARAVAFTAPSFAGDTGQYPFHFLPYASQAFLDGSLAHLPWLQELPDPMTSAMWSSWVEMNPKTAAAAGIAQGDIVEITSSAGSLRAPAFVSPAIAPDVIAMPVGQGHQTFTRFASGRGVNPVEILAPIAEAETGALAWAATRVNIARVGDDDGRLILFAGEMRENPHEGAPR